MTNRVAIASVTRAGRGVTDHAQDLVAIEAPLAVQMRLPDSTTSRPLGVFMRTPGDDVEFVLGLLYAEGIIRTGDDVESVTVQPATDDAAETATVMLSSTARLDAIPEERAVVASSACGLCGRLAVAGLDRLASRASAPPVSISAGLVSILPQRLREQQTAFAETGGLHAAGFFDAGGRLLSVREDVGRHNAVDKLVGAALAEGGLPAAEQVLVVSGRVAFEIVQKAVMAGVPILVAIGAPSSLAIDAARAARLTLIGFARDGRFNVYSGQERIRPE